MSQREPRSQAERGVVACCDALARPLHISEFQQCPCEIISRGVAARRLLYQDFKCQRRLLEIAPGIIDQPRISRAGRYCGFRLAAKSSSRSARGNRLRCASAAIAWAPLCVPSPPTVNRRLTPIAFQQVHHYGRLFRTSGGAENGATELVNRFDEFRSQPCGWEATVRVETAIAVANAEDFLHAIAVVELQEDRAYGVVQAGTQPAAGHDRSHRRGRIEINVFTRFRLFKRQVESKVIRGNKVGPIQKAGCIRCEVAKLISRLRREARGDLNWRAPSCETVNALVWARNYFENPTEENAARHDQPGSEGRNGPCLPCGVFCCSCLPIGLRSDAAGVRR